VRASIREELADHIAALGLKLARLERSDRGRFWQRRAPSVFGANRHRYARRPVREGDIAALEASLGTSIPTELSALWLGIGAGVGPYYGLFTPAEVGRELEVWISIAADEGREVDLRAPFPLRTPDGSATIQILDGPTPGCLPIAHQGDTFWSVLVLNGSEVGHVWDYAAFLTTEWQWIPARRPPGRLGSRHSGLPAFEGAPTLIEWYEGWLDEALASLPPVGDR
jgi:hypothetical protein